MGIAAIGLGVAGIASAGIGAVGANMAANTEVQGEEQAAQVQEQDLAKTQGILAPFVSAGQPAATELGSYPNFNFAPTQANLATTPGYQFSLQQGLLSTQNSAAARGLGVSGASYKGAQGYAEGLAGTTYQNQFQNALNTYGTNLGRVQNLANLGENAAAMTGQYNTQAGANIGQTAVGAANAAAQGTIGATNAASSAVGSLGQAYLLNSFLNPNSGSLYGSGAGSLYGTASTDPSALMPSVFGLGGS